MRKADIKALQAHFGKRYASSLLMPSRAEGGGVWGTVRYVREDLRGDDTVDVVRARIAVHVAEVQRTAAARTAKTAAAPRMHLWCRTHMQPDSIACRRAAQGLFRNRGVVSRLEVSGWCVRAFVSGEKVLHHLLTALSHPDVLSWEQLQIGLKAAAKAVPGGLVGKQVLGVSVAYGAHLVAPEPDLAELCTLAATEAGGSLVERALGGDAAAELTGRGSLLSSVWKGAELMECYAPDGGVLELMLESDMQHQQFPGTLKELYMGWAPTHMRFDAGDARFAAADASMREYESAVRAATGDTVRPKQQCFVSFLHLRCNEGGVPGADVQLLNVFERLQLDALVPFARLHRNGRAAFKLWRRFFADPELQVASVTQWFPSVSGEYHGGSSKLDHLVLKVACKPAPGLNKHATLVLHSSLSYELKFAFRHGEMATLEGVASCMLVVAKVLARVRGLLGVSKHVLPDPDVKMWAHSIYTGGTRIFKLVTLAVTNPAGPAPRATTAAQRLERLLKVAQMRLLPYVGVVQGSDKGLLHLVYKRVSDFSSEAGVRMCLERFVTQRTAHGRAEPSTREMVDLITQHFGLSETDARSAVEAFTAQKALGGRNAAAQRASFAAGRRSVSLKLRAHERTGYVMYVDVGSVSVSGRVLARIHELVRYMVAAAAGTLPTTAAHAYMPLPAEVASAGSSASRQSTLEEALEDEDAHGEMDAELERMLMELARGNDVAPVAVSVEDAEKASAAIGAALDVADADTNAPARHLLGRLYAADKKLFDTPDKVFSRTCQLSSGRQPVAVTDAELTHIVGEHPGAIADSVRYGSDAQHVHNYICPRIWCPRSRVALTREEYEKLGGRCPPQRVGNTLVDTGEVPIIQDSASYWGKSGDKPRYVGFLSPTKHPEGLCMPCCFATPRQKWGKCIKPESAAAMAKAPKAKATKEAAEPSSDKEGTNGNARYIMDYDARPTEPGRLALLPRALARVLSVPGVTRCGGRTSGAGLITVATKACFVRAGVTDTRQPLLEAAAHVLGVQGGATALVKAICEHLTPLDFVGLNGGVMTRFFAPDGVDASLPGAGVSKSNVRAFAAWAGRHTASYFGPMGISRVGTACAALHHSLDDAPAELRLPVLREYIVYAAFQNFRNYMTNDSLRKSHELLLDLLNLRRPWLNPRGVNIAVVEVDDTGAAYVACPLFRDARTMYDYAAPWVLLLRHGARAVYEPIAYVTGSRKGSDIASVFELWAAKDPPLPPQLLAALSAARERCLGPRASVTMANTAAVVSAVSAQGLVLQAAAVSPDYRVPGIVFADTSGRMLYVPLAAWESMLTPAVASAGKFMHVEQVYAAKQWVPRSVALRVFALLHSKFPVPDFYRVLGERVKGGVLELSGGVGVPLREPISAHALQSVRDDTNLFLALTLHDARIAYTSRVEAREALQDWYRAELGAAIARQPALQEALYFLRHPNNPMPLSARRAKAHAFLEPLLKELVVTAPAAFERELEQAASRSGKIARTHDVCLSLKRKSQCTAPRCTWVTQDKKHARCALQVPASSAELLVERFVDELLTGEDLGSTVEVFAGEKGRSSSSGVVLLTDTDLLAVGGDVQRLLETLRGIYSVDYDASRSEDS